MYEFLTKTLMSSVVHHLFLSDEETVVHHCISWLGTQTLLIWENHRKASLMRPENAAALQQMLPQSIKEMASSTSPVVLL